MRLIRFGPAGQERPGLLRNGKIVELTRIFPEIPDIGEQFFRQGWVARVAEVDDPGRKLDVRLGCPVSRPSKIICLGKNYAEHAKEGALDVPDKPLLFCKAPSALTGPFDPIVLPGSSGQVDWEVELAVVIGRQGKLIPQSQALNYVAGYSILNDVSAREAQFSDSQWFRGKSFDTFAPMGPALVTPDEVGDIDNLVLTTRVDGELMQDGNTGDLIFKIPTLIEYISQDITLLPGDIISTGTPAGVGIFRNPPVVLRPGNVVECRIDPIGALRNPVVGQGA